MPDLDYLIHFPMLRIEEEFLPFAGAQLWRAPFEKYDHFSLGAFSEQRARYDETAPVFLSFSITHPEDGLERRSEEVNGMIEVKMPSARTDMLDQLGLYPINYAHREIATAARTALLLAAPASALAPPRWSQTFMSIDGGFTLNIGGKPAVAVRVQGEADHEYLFMPDAPSAPLPSETVARAAALVRQVGAWEKIPDLHAALTALRATGLPMLSRQVRLTIAVQALEALLLPEVRTSLKSTFARRAAALLGANQQSASRIHDLARDLYRLRSESVHGGVLSSAEALVASYAEQMLAAAIQAMGKRLESGQGIDQLRTALDAGAVADTDYAELIVDRPVGRASDYRLAPREPSSDVVSVMSAMAPGEKGVCCWSPLLGLATDGLGEGIAVGKRPTPALMPLSPAELMDLEERDIRRDFFAQFVTEGQSMAVLYTRPYEEEPDPVAVTPWLERMRDLGVVTLRLAGYDKFHDPELFGSAVFQGARRLRHPTALRQTIAEELRHEAEQRVTAADAPRLAQLWEDVRRYQEAEPSYTIEYVLTVFRRSFDREFLEPEQRALLLIGLLDRMLGRFRAQDEPVQLEDLVAALVGPSESTTWFREQGRAFRNRVAHGEFSNEDAGEPIEQMSRVVTRLVLALIQTWNAADEKGRRDPTKALITRATQMLVTQ